MLNVSCPYCGRIHPYNFDCDKRPRFKQQDKGTEAYKFRHGSKWRDKSKAIRARDNYLCIYCKKQGIINNTAIEVHHITKVKDNFNARLDGYNLISLCREHHEEAERGDITADELKKLAKMQEDACAGDKVCG